MTPEDYLQAENLMRGKEARRGNLNQLMAFDVGSKVLATIVSMFGMYLSLVIGTTGAHLGAIYAMAAAANILANGKILLHRKWIDYSASEKKSQHNPQAWYNSALDINPLSRSLVAITSALVYGCAAIPVWQSSIPFLIQMGTIDQWMSIGIALGLNIIGLLILIKNPPQ